MKTTLNVIKLKMPCKSSWIKLLESLGKTKADDEPISLIYILETLDIKDAIWCLRCFDYKDYCLFLADIAESVLPIYEKKHPDNDAPRKAIEAIRKYHKGEIDREQLTAAAYAAAAYADAAAAAYAAYAAAAYAAAADAAYAAAAYAAAADAAYAAAAYADAAAARMKKWEEIEVMFRKHFGNQSGKY
jgi:hypothetical protein